MGSVALHALVAALLMISWRYTRDLKLGSAVPVTIVANAPPGELQQAQVAPEVQAAQAEQPQAQAKPEPVPPETDVKFSSNGHGSFEQAVQVEPTS